ncbi:hypothetical protein C2S51_031522 [Perilla frutescens var. frutescens]|nr:hypothetical protein C2S51_031522 [Perilla frutescens var. frutescens]
MVGLSDQYSELKRKILNEDAKFKVFSIVGMGGIGKTTLARKVYEDLDVLGKFDIRVWVRVGRKCGSKEIPRRIVAQLYLESDQMLVEANHDDDLVAGFLRKSLKGKKYLIVLDDVWGKYVEYHLHQSFRYERNDLKNPFPDDGNGSRVLLTTRVQQMTEINQVFPDDLTVRFMNKEESWDLLREKVFVDESCPLRLERFGKKIAENCDGLPLTIVTIADLLSKAEKTVECWSKIVAHKNHQIFLMAYDEVSKVLLPSYEYLPRVLQTCFLYMGVFRSKYKIPRAKLITMWDIDGFLELNAHKFSYPSAMECLDELVHNSLVMIYQRTTDSTATFGGKQIVKTCGLHSSLWYLSNKEGGKTKFFHVLNSFDDGFGEGIESQHRLSFHNNVLFGIKEVYESVEDNCASTAHSLLCYGPYHKYQVPICFGLRLLKKLDAVTIRFYEFPLEILQLVQLKYLALTLDGKIPASISELLSLQFLIVSRHLSINSCSEPSYLPKEIWNMKELKHLQVMGGDLPDPCGDSLERLSTLSNVSAHSCVEAILEATPQLNKLGIRIELAFDEDSNHLSCFDHISCLKELRSLKCVVVNPDVVPPPTPLPIFPARLEKLSLSGLGYSWKEMSSIASLPNLNVLKLRNYAFQGSVWEVEEKKFISLILLVIEDTDLVEWKIGSGSFIWLQHLSIKHCYKLERIEGEFEVFLENIEVNDSPSAATCAEQIRNGRMRKRNILPEPDVDVHSSWVDGHRRA